MKQKILFQVMKSHQLSILLMAGLLFLQTIPTITARANQAQARLQVDKRQNSSYTRALADSGQANEIIIFKSFFPNSALSGNSNDPPSSDGWLTVGHAKKDSLASPTIQGCPIFPANNIWNTPVDNLPIHSRSSQWINTIGRNTGFHMDFGSGTWDGGPIGIPYNIVDGSIPKVPVSFYYDDESDVGPYPIPANPLIEYGSDHHLLLLEYSTCTLYEIYDASYSAGMWHGGSGAIWALSSNALRPDTWTSADAAGLPILPGLVRYDEIVSGEINHAIRFTASQTNGYIWPARHLTTDDPSSPQIPPMGARFRLKASFDISGYPAEMRVLLQAMKKYGIILADNGSNWYVSGTPDERWDNDMLHLLDDLTGDDFEAVDVSSLMVDPDSGEVHPPVLPGAFEKSGPINDVQDLSLNPTISWIPSGDATSYEYCYSSTAGPCTQWHSVGANTSVSLSGLAPNYTYYWQVRAVNAGGSVEADDGTWWSFTTVAAPACTWPAYTAPTSATFGDVPMDVGHWSWVERLANATITAGCGSGNYCPFSDVVRAQMAIFLLRGKHCGSSYTPPAVGATTGFGDVHLDATYAPWVKQLAAEGITAGCGGGNFCPLQIVNRAQMAIFLLRAKHGASYTPPAVGASTGFGDVPLDASYAPWVKQLAAEGITAGCGGGNFCPLQNVNRAQMATFLVRAFGLP